MRSKPLHIVCLISFLFYANAYGQADTTLLLPEMEVLKIRQVAIGTEKLVWDSTELKARSFNSLADFLTQESNVYVKSYGGNSLGTISVRGASAAQTLLLWNGLPVQSPMLGLLDLALIPLNFSDEIKLQVGGNSSSWGSGAIGGVLSLVNQSEFQNNVDIDYLSSIGSYSNLQQALKVGLGNKHFQSVSKLNFQKSSNDILVRPAPNVENYRQSNAAFQQIGFLQSFYIRPNDKNELSLHAWVQESNKEIPPTLTQRISEASQVDNFKRFMGTWSLNLRKHHLQTRIGHFSEKQEFNDPQIELEALNQFSTTLSELSYTIQLAKKHSIELANTTTFTKAQSKSYQGNRTQLKTAGLFAYKYQGVKTQLQISVREEWVDQKFLLPVPYLGWQQFLGRGLSLKAKFSRDFRLPTLNDLYWNPGGNPDLKPEEGWGQELGVHWTTQFKKHRLSLSNTVFNRNIKNWILWAPSDIGFFWGAQNVAKVWSYGLSSSFEYMVAKKKFKLNTKVDFNYTRSSYQVDLDLPTIAKGDQLLYTPKFQGNARALFQLGPWGIQYQHQVVGETQGANDLIPAYHIGNLHFTYGFKQQKISGNIFISMLNIYNQNYIIVERRPMPGTNVQLGIHLNFKK